MSFNLGNLIGGVTGGLLGGGLPTPPLPPGLPGLPGLQGLPGLGGGGMGGGMSGGMGGGMGGGMIQMNENSDMGPGVNLESLLQMVGGGQTQTQMNLTGGGLI